MRGAELADRLRTSAHVGSRNPVICFQVIHQEVTR
jgi:hypothetical protein